MEWIRIFDAIGTMNQALADNSPRLLIVDGRRICLVRRGEQLSAVQDACTHNGESLSKGTVNYLGEIVCPWHGYRFDIKSGRECAERSRDLVTYPVRIESDGVFIGM